VAAAIAVILAVSATPTQAARLKTIEIPDRHGELSQHWLDHPGEPRADVLLPDRYDPKKPYPLLLLLAGFTNDYATWVTDGHADEILGNLNAIVVMPEAGRGWYADWWNDGMRGDPAFESYYLDEVIPQIRKRYEIRKARRYHAVIGVSMGGLGAAYLGGRLPGFFGSVGMISGFLDMQYLPGITGVQSLLAGGSSPESLYGPEGSFYEDGHNPTRLVRNLADARVYVGVGDGTVSSRGVDNPSDAQTNAAKESAILRPMTDNWMAAAERAGLDVTFSPHPGVHDWPDFEYDLSNIVRWGLFKPVAKHSRFWTNKTVATHGELWGIDYRFDTAPDRVVRFQRSARHLLISDSGSRLTLRPARGCKQRLATPTTIKLPLC
jgi:S-formylglutathione hydrolase FrmB